MLAQDPSSLQIVGYFVIDKIPVVLYSFAQFCFGLWIAPESSLNWLRRCKGQSRIVYIRIHNLESASRV